MRKVQETMKLGDILTLEMEVNGFERNEIKIPAFIAHSMNIKTKYWLAKLSKTLKAEADSFHAFRDELIKKFGKEDDEGVIKLEMKVDNEINPKFIEFTKEEQDLLNQEVAFELYKFPIDDFNFETDYTYATIGQYLIDDDS